MKCDDLLFVVLVFVYKTGCVRSIFLWDVLNIVTMCCKTQQLYADMSLVSNRKQKQSGIGGAEEGICSEMFQYSVTHRQEKKTDGNHSSPFSNTSLILRNMSKIDFTSNHP